MHPGVLLVCVHDCRSMLASVVQTQGMSQGWLFNPDTMELMWNNTAMYESLRMLKVGK